MTNQVSTSRAAEERGAAKAEPQGAFKLLMPELQRAVTRQGYLEPTEIQELSIPELLKGRDLLGSAQTGTGKTAAFTLPLLQTLAAAEGRPQRNTPRALILAPTRELAAQIGDSVHTYGKYLKLTHTVIYGGVSQQSQVRALNRGVDILVATPGRLLDLMAQRHIYLDELQVFILDEVDRMLDMGFIHDIKRILEEIPEERQTLFFSATLPPKMVALASSMVTDPVRVSVAPGKPTVDRIEQKVLFVSKKDKDKLLQNLLDDKDFNRAIVFTQMKHMANRVVEKLLAAGVKAEAIHGNKSQAARTKALQGFKRGKYQVLVATDVASRGIDVDDITHVINYDLPVEAETYVHRIGRTARAGAEGIAISFCTAEDRACLKDIEKLLGKKVPSDLEHEYHSEDAYHSSLPAPKWDKGSKRSGGRGRSHGAFERSPHARTRSRSRRRNPSKRS